MGVPRKHLGRSVTGSDLGRAASSLRARWRALDTPTLSGVTVALVFLVAGLLMLGLAVLVPEGGSSPDVDLRVAGACVVAGLVGPFLPWSRWPDRSLLAYPFLGFVLVAVGGRAAGGAGGASLAMVSLLFVFVGFTQPAGTSMLLLPAAAVALAVASGGTWSPVLVANVVITLPMSVVAGEAVAQAVRRQRGAERRIERLLEAVRVLARVRDERVGAEVVAGLAAELLDADAVCVLLTERRGGTRLLNRAWCGHPALADAAPLTLDALADPGLHAGSSRFFPDASMLPLADSAVHHSVRSGALVPLPGDRGPIGVLLALWGTPRSALPASASQAAELLSQEAGRMFSRLRTTAVLTRAARTDPLTSLANRRAFTRALNGVHPGDAVMIVDLDHFKAVNDRHGHAAGDATLRAFARCLRAVSRQGDCVARIGGEEFAFVLAGAGRAGARATLLRLYRAWQVTGPVTTFSAGVAVHEAGEGARITLRQADEALYRAKEQGRDRVEFAAREVVLS